MPYADWEYYSETFGGSAERSAIEPLLARASDAIDALTFSRVNAIGWDGLTEFQQEGVRRACCLQADFYADNADALDTPLGSYSINGVSMSFGNAALYSSVGGTAAANSALSVLRQTGLVSRCARPGEVRA